MELWDSAKEENSYGAYEQYLEQYPAGFFSAVAEDYIELLDTQKSIQTYEKYASNDDQWLLDNDRKLLAMTEQRVNSEAAVRYALAEKLLKLDVPTF
jgi:hypothetical protein